MYTQIALKCLIKQEKKSTAKGKAHTFLKYIQAYPESNNQDLTILNIHMWCTYKFTINFKQTFLQNKFSNITVEVYLSHI